MIEKLLSIAFILMTQVLAFGVECRANDVITGNETYNNQADKLLIEKSFGIKKISSCKAQLDNGDFIDLTILDNLNSLRFFLNLFSTFCYKYLKRTF